MRQELKAGVDHGGIGGTAILIRKWKLRTVPMPPPSATPHFTDIRDRIRRETEL
jgi:cytochrome c-type biogenesis protein CcmH